MVDRTLKIIPHRAIKDINISDIIKLIAEVKTLAKSKNKEDNILEKTNRGEMYLAISNDKENHRDKFN